MKIFAGNENFGFRGPETEDESEEVEGYLFLSLGLNTKQNTWAGPDHWKYRKPKGMGDALVGGSYQLHLYIFCLSSKVNITFIESACRFRGKSCS